MKKGCFFTTVTIGTILIGIIFYIGDKYGDNIFDYFKGRVVDLTLNSADEYFDKIEQSEYKDSLKVLWKDAYNKAKLMEFEEGINYMSEILLKIDRYAKDSLISSKEITTIKNLIDNDNKQEN